MHVLYIVGQSTGGLPHYSAELANAMTKHADVTVMKPTETSADDLFDEQVDIRNSFESIAISMPKVYDMNLNPVSIVQGIASYSRMQAIREIDADVIHDPTGLFPQVKLFTRLYDIDDRPFVVTRHEVPIRRFSLADPDILLESAAQALLPGPEINEVIVHTKQQRKALIEQGTNQKDIHVIPHGAYEVFGTYESVEVDPEPNSLLFFGHVVPLKGIDTLVEALPIVAQVIPDVTLTIAGEGHLSKSAQETIGAYPTLFEVLDYHIPNDEVKELFGRTQLVVLPYRDPDGTNGHSGALSTAFSFGKPIVASTAGEFPELVEETGCGLVVPPNNAKALASAIIKILINDKKRSEMAANSRRMADRLSWDSIAERYHEVYQHAIDDHPQTANNR